MSECILSEKEKRFVGLVKSRMTESDTQEELEAAVFPAILSLDGENDNPFFEDALAYVENNPDATVQQICDYICSLLPPVEIVDDDEDESA
ncbi:MAG: hypothetical protein IJ784_05040 [Ruminiclostridium sp.]|nr:hypothetical protein [Ruminiclostridium sp.]